VASRAARTDAPRSPNDAEMAGFLATRRMSAPAPVRSTTASRTASRSRRRARFRWTARPTSRGTATAMRAVPRSFGRERAERWRSDSAGRIARTAAMSRVRRKRAASIAGAALGDGEPLATTRATRSEDLSPRRRLHSRAETMHARATASLGLIGALHDRVPFFESGWIKNGIVGVSR